jgi:hypothetical protein
VKALHALCAIVGAIVISILALACFFTLLGRAGPSLIYFLMAIIVIYAVAAIPSAFKRKQPRSR